MKKSTIIIEIMSKLDELMFQIRMGTVVSTVISKVVCFSQIFNETDSFYDWEGRISIGRRKLNNLMIKLGKTRITV